MTMTKKDLLEFLQTLESNLKVDISIITKELSKIKLAGDTTNADKAHLDWEIAHMNTSYQDFLRDIGRVIKTLEGKPFNAC